MIFPRPTSVMWCALRFLFCHESPDRPALKAATVMKAFFLGIATLTAVSSWGMYFVCRAEALTNVACYRVVGQSEGCATFIVQILIELLTAV